MEPTEISEFSRQMEEASESSTAAMTRVSLLISILAVLVAMVTVLGHRQHTEAILLQARVSDTWNEYQARKMRLQQINTATDLLILQPSSNDRAVQAKLAEYKARTAKWQQEIDANNEKAKNLEAEVEQAERKAGRFDLGEAMLQISVVLASITLLTRQHRYVIVALALGLGGLLFAASAFLLH